MSKDEGQIHQEVSEYYAKLNRTEDLVTNSCCSREAVPKNIRDIIGLLHDTVTSKYFGCGLCIPSLLVGCKVLDLGSGAGRDCFICQNLVGENGYVIGVDMTDKMLEVANSMIPFHTERFGYGKPNIEFKKGNLDNLEEVGLADDYFDVVISNCVINLCTNKEAVLRQVYRVLKEGGEFYFSDIYSNRRVPESLKSDPVLYNECLTGSMYVRDFLLLAQRVGFHDPREVQRTQVNINNKAVEEKVKGYPFQSITYRLFKISSLERSLEDYGHKATYKGTIPESPESFRLDRDHIFNKGVSVSIDGNTAKILQLSRFALHFEIDGDFSTHLGEFKLVNPPRNP